jgi:hypothetical protein
VEVSPESLVADGLGVIQNMSQIKDEPNNKKGTKATEQGPPSSVEGGRKEPAIPEAPEEKKDGADAGNAAEQEKQEKKEKEDDKEEKKKLHGKDKAEESVSQYLYVRVLFVSCFLLKDH